MAYQISGNTVIDNSRNGSFVNADLESLSVPTGTNGTKPSSPSAGTLRFNTTFSVLEMYDGSAWKEVPIGGVIS